MADNRIVGLEMSSHYIRAAEIENFNKKNPILKKFYELPIPQGIIRDGEVLDTDLMSDALRKLWALGKFTTRRVVVGMGNQRVLVRNKKIFDMSIDHVKSSLQFLVGDELPIAIDEAILDFYPIHEDKEKKEIEGLFLSVVKEVVEKNLKALEKAKLYPVSIDLIPFALTRSLIDPSKKDVTNIILNIGSKSTHVTVVDKGVPVFVRFIPAGNDDVIEGVQKVTGLDYAQSLEIIHTLGVGSEPKDEQSEVFTRIINEQVNSIYKSIRNTITYFQEQNENTRYRNIIIVGPGVKIPRLAEFFAKALGIPLELGDPSKIVKINKNVLSHYNGADMSISIGLALGDHNG